MAAGIDPFDEDAVMAYEKEQEEKVWADAEEEAERQTKELEAQE